MYGICVCNLQGWSGVIGNPNVYGNQIGKPTVVVLSHRHNALKCHISWIDDRLFNDTVLLSIRWNERVSMIPKDWKGSDHGVL
jgi:hypothetical protein